MKFKFMVRSSGFLSSLVLVGCSNTPNSINMSVSQGNCVQSSSYKGVTPPAIIANNPTTAPYCASVTIQNNNSGRGATNVQTTVQNGQGGLSLSYTANTSSGAVSYNGILCDNAASNGVCASQGAGGNVGNINIFDPNNCGTAQGGKVISINSGGGTCTFYLQLNAESYQVGSYGATINYTYTNGNSNYTVITNMHEVVNLYAGSTQGVFVANNNSWVSFFNVAQVTYSNMIKDGYGNLYYGQNNGLVMQYNGLSITQVGNSLGATIPVLGLNTDSASNLYALTSASASNTYYLNLKGVTAKSTWQPLNLKGITGTVIGLTSGVTNGMNVLYATTYDQAYQCIATTLTPPNYSCAVLGSDIPNDYYSNALTINQFGQPYVGSNNAVFTYMNNQWVPLNFSNMPTGRFWGLATNNKNILYLGENNESSGALAIESASYGCVLSGGVNLCSPLLSNTKNNLLGNIYGTTIDGAGFVYFVGGGFNSADFVGVSNVAGAYIGENYGLVATSKWIPIAGSVGTSNLQTVVVSSVLTQ